MLNRSPPVIIILLLLTSSILLGGVVADSTSSFSVKATTSIDAPDRTISFEGEDYHVSTLGSIDEGDTLRFDVSRPGDSIFTAYLYNTDRQIVDSIRRTSNGTYAFTDASLKPGTYVLTLDVDGETQAIQPVVVSGYEFEVDAPKTVSEGDQISVTATIPDNPQQVDVVLFNETWEHTVIASEIGSDEYNAVIDTELAPGEYSLYVGTRSSETVDGERVLNGISEPQTVTVEPAQTTTTPPSTTQSSSPQPTPTTTSTVTTTTQTTNNPTTQSPANETNTTTQPATSRSTPTSTTATTAPTTEPVQNNSSTTDSIITPNTPSQDTTDTTTPGFTASTAGIAFIAVLALVWRRQ